MNQVIRNLDNVKAKMKEKWNKLTDRDFEESHGKVDDLQGRLKKAYGYDDMQARKEFEDFSVQNRLEFDEEDRDIASHVEEPVSPAAPITPRDDKKIIQ